MGMRRFAVLVALLATASCSDSTGPSLTPSEALTALTAAETQWLATRPVTYGVVQERWCECGPRAIELIATRRQGAIIPSPNEVISMANIVGGGPVEPSSVLTIQQLFAFIRGELERATGPVELRFDPVWSFPTFFRHDPNPSQWADEVQIRLVDFQVFGVRDQP